MKKRPKCQVSGCNRGAHNAGNGRWRKSKGANGGYICMHHHQSYHANQKGISRTDWENGFHPYRKYRKDYCENKDARLGFKCTAKIIWKGMLAVDHIDENNDNNNVKNHQTFCHNCHVYKTNLIRRLFFDKERDDTVWKILKNMLRFSGKDTVNRNILKRWKEKYA